MMQYVKDQRIFASPTHENDDILLLASTIYDMRYTNDELTIDF